MNLKQTSLILKKINRLHELIDTIGEASSTETDLLKAYIVDLYEAVVMSDIEELSDLEEEAMLKKIKKRKKVEKKLKKKVIKRSDIVEEDDDFEAADEVEELVEKEVVAPVIKVEKEEKVSVPVEEPAPVKKVTEPVIAEELFELFDLSSSAELSDKLANAPIKDLTKAMGINERIFTANELFDGNHKEMDNILLALNGLETFDEAKSVLMHSVAQKNKWAEGAKVKKAKNFIKLVKRRFN